ncbi:MAG TPA: helix-turn-helix domain-containing protein [Candidatus Elarobacter sp.]|nr:helix-turn-helix domain-containing protein [Candidatus Elarobacter sp.]
MAKPDRRVERTRSALQRAFGQLLLARGYAAVTVREVIERAGVGRSTFYEHFESKEDVLRQSMRPLLGILAAVVDDGAPLAAVEQIVAHFHDNRRIVRALSAGPARAVITTFLAELIEERLDASRARMLAPSIPMRLIAAQLAGSQLALLDAWLAAPQATPAAAVAQAIVSGTRSAAAALLAGRDEANQPVRARETSMARAASSARAIASRR